MDMQVIDTVHADKVEEGDFISFDGPICAVKEIIEKESDEILFISEDDREIAYNAFHQVDIFGYMND